MLTFLFFVFSARVIELLYRATEGCEDSVTISGFSAEDDTLISRLWRLPGVTALPKVI